MSQSGTPVSQSDIAASTAIAIRGRLKQTGRWYSLSPKFVEKQSIPTVVDHMTAYGTRTVRSVFGSLCVCWLQARSNTVYFQQSSYTLASYGVEGLCTSCDGSIMPHRFKVKDLCFRKPASGGQQLTLR